MIPILPSGLILWARTAAARWRVVPWEAFNELLPTNDELIDEIEAVAEEVRQKTSTPAARTVMVTNTGNGRVDLYVNGKLWGPLERSNEANGRIIVAGHLVTSIGVRLTSGTSTTVRVVFLRRI